MQTLLIAACLAVSAPTPQDRQPVESGRRPVARLLGKPVFIGDLKSRSEGIGSPEVGIESLVLSVLKREFCAARRVEVTDADIAAYIERATMIVRKLDGKHRAELEAAEQELASADLPPDRRAKLEATKRTLARKIQQYVPAKPFDARPVTARLEEIREALRDPALPWLERMTLERAERAAEFSISHRSSSAGIAYRDLVALKGDRALYDHYGGKVVTSQISLHPAGAYARLVEEAERDGRLVFLDEGIEKDFRRRMKNSLDWPHMPVERVDFTWPSWVSDQVIDMMLEPTRRRPPEDAAPEPTGH